MKLIRSLLVAGLVGTACASAQEKKDPPAAEKKDPAPTPAEGKKDEITQGFHAYVIAEPRFPKGDIRDRTGKMQDLVTDHGLDPTIAVFSREIPKNLEHPLTAVVKKIDELSLKPDYKARRLGGFLVFLSLTDEFRKDPPGRDMRIGEAEKFAAGVMSKATTIALSEAKILDEGNQPLEPAQVTAMGVGADDDYVIVFYYKFNVIKRWSFKAASPPDEATLKELDAEVAKLLAPKKK
jgi:hypothetical protein